MNPINTALSSGYTPLQILNYMQSAFPSLAPQISQAVKYGYTPLKIISFLSNLIGGGEEVRGGTEAQQEALSGEQFQQGAKQAATTGLGILTSLGVGRALGGLAGRTGGIGGGMGNPLPSPPFPRTPMPSPQPPIGPQPMGNAPVQPAPIPPVGPSATPNLPPTPPNLPVQQPQPTLPTQMPPTANIPPEQSVKTLDAMGLTNKIKNLSNAGNDPETIAVALSQTLTPNQKHWLADQIKSGTAKPLGPMVEDYLSTNPMKQGTSNVQEPQSQPQKQEMLESPGEKLDEAEKESEAKRPKKGDLVFDESSGVTGQLKDIKQKEALVEEDGKLHKAKTDSLLHSELPEKDLAELHEDLIKGIEKSTEKQVSRNVEYAGYDPDHNELVYRPYLGGTYVYEDISPEDAELLTSFLTKRKTSGESLIGAWEKDTESPIGAAMSALIKRLQQERGGKGEEYSRKFQTIYSAYEPAQLAAKKKKAEEAKRKKEEEKRKKKK